jgi:hypothetical protein
LVSLTAAVESALASFVSAWRARGYAAAVSFSLLNGGSMPFAAPAARRPGDEKGRHGWFSQTEPPHIGQRSGAIGRDAP